jgi:hypothetical protein
MSKKSSDKLFAHLLQNDQIGKPDRAIEERLMYSFLLKSSGSKTKQNSFANFFGWLFSAQSIGLKTGLTAGILFFMVVNSHFSVESEKINCNDSLSTQRVLVADSTRVIQNIDSIHTYNLKLVFIGFNCSSYLKSLIESYSMRPF